MILNCFGKIGCTEGFFLLATVVSWKITFYQLGIPKTFRRDRRYCTKKLLSVAESS